MLKSNEQNYLKDIADAYQNMDIDKLTTKVLYNAMLYIKKTKNDNPTDTYLYIGYNTLNNEIDIWSGLDSYIGIFTASIDLSIPIRNLNRFESDNFYEFEHIIQSILIDIKNDKDDCVTDAIAFIATHSGELNYADILAQKLSIIDLVNSNVNNLLELSIYIFNNHNKKISIFKEGSFSFEDINNIIDSNYLRILNLDKIELSSIEFPIFIKELRYSQVLQKYNLLFKNNNEIEFTVTKNTDFLEKEFDLIIQSLENLNYLSDKYNGMVEQLPSNDYLNALKFIQKRAVWIDS